MRKQTLMTKTVDNILVKKLKEQHLMTKAVDHNCLVKETKKVKPKD